MNQFEEIAQVQKTLEESFAVLRQKFEEAQKSFQKKNEMVLAGIKELQKQEAESLQQISTALQKILGEGNNPKK